MNEMTRISAQPAYSDAAGKALARKPKLFIDGEWVEFDPRQDAARRSTPRPGARSAASSTPPTPTSTAPSPPRAPRSTTAAGPACRRSCARAIMHKLADLIERHADELAELEAIDNGKPKGIAAALDIPGRGRHAALHGRLGDQDRRRDDARRCGCPAGACPRLCPPRAGRRRRPDRAVELPADDGGAEDRAGARRGLHASCSSRPSRPR